MMPDQDDGLHPSYIAAVFTSCVDCDESLATDSNYPTLLSMYTYTFN